MAQWSSSAPKGDCVDAAERLIRNQTGTGIERGHLEALVDTIVLWLSRYEPRTVSDATLDGDGTTWQFALSLLSVAWVQGFSRIHEIEHPLDERPKSTLDPQGYYLNPRAPAETSLYFADTPASGTNNIRVVYTTVHALTSSSTSIPANEQPAYEYALACQACRL